MSVLVPVTTVTKTTAKKQHMYKLNEIDDTTQNGKKGCRQFVLHFIRHVHAGEYCDIRTGHIFVTEHCDWQGHKTLKTPVAEI